MLLQFDGTFILIVISFVIFMFAMQAVFYGPMMKVRQERQAYIDNKKQSADNSLEEADMLKKRHESKIKDARITASQEVLKSTNQASKEKSQALEKVNADISVKISQSRDKIDKEKYEAKNALKSEVTSLAHLISTRVLGEDIPMVGDSTHLIDNILNG